MRKKNIEYISWDDFVFQRDAALQYEYIESGDFNRDMWIKWIGLAVTLSTLAFLVYINYVVLMFAIGQVTP